MKSVELQLNDVIKNVTDDLKKAAVIAVNEGAYYLEKQAHKAARFDGKGKSVANSIKVRPAPAGSYPPKAVVYLDTDQVKHAAYVHENYKGYKITPKVKKYLYIPKTAKGRRHELYKNDTGSLKGIIIDPGNKKAHGTRLGTWPKGKKGEKQELDFVLVKEANIPANKRAGFLTDTANSEKSEIIRIMKKEIEEFL